MAYTISGNSPVGSRILIFDENDWSLEVNTLVSGTSAYGVEVSSSGERLIVSRNTDGEVLGYGRCTPHDNSGGGPSGPEPPAAGTWNTYTVTSVVETTEYKHYRVNCSYNPVAEKLGVVYPTADALQDTRYLEGTAGSYGASEYITTYYELLQMVHDASGKAHASWQQDGNIYYSTNTTGSWVTIEVASCYALDDPDYGTDIAMDSNGKIWIAYGAYEEDAGDDTGLYVVTNATGSWVAERAIPTDYEVVSGNVCIEIDSSNVKHITYYDYNDQESQRYVWGTTGGWSVENIPSTGMSSSSGGRVHMTIDSDSKVHMAYAGQEITGGSGEKGDPYTYDYKIGYGTNKSGSWVETFIAGASPVTTSSYSIDHVVIMCGGSDSVYIVSWHGNGSNGTALNFATNKSGSWTSTNVISTSTSTSTAFMGADIYGTKIYVAYAYQDASDFPDYDSYIREAVYG